METWATGSFNVWYKVLQEVDLFISEVSRAKDIFNKFSNTLEVYFKNFKS